LKTYLASVITVAEKHNDIYVSSAYRLAAKHRGKGVQNEFLFTIFRINLLQKTVCNLHKKCRNNSMLSITGNIIFAVLFLSQKFLNLKINFKWMQW